MKFTIVIITICLVTFLSNLFYIFNATPPVEKAHEAVIFFTYKTPDNTTWINKNKAPLQRLRNHYIEQSDSIISRLEAEKQTIIPHDLLAPEMQRKLLSSYNLDTPTQDKSGPSDAHSLKFLIVNSIIILSGFTVICFVCLMRRPKESDQARAVTENEHKAGPGPTISNPDENFGHIYDKNIENVKGSVELNKSKILDKTKEITCEILQLINDYSENCVVAKRSDFEDFTSREIIKIKDSSTLNDFLDIEDEIKRIVPPHFQTVRDLIKVKFDEIIALTNDIAKDFEAVTVDNTSFSGQIKSSMSHIEKAIEMDEVKEIRKKITHETGLMRATITKKQEKDAEVINVLTHRIKTMNDELTSAKEETMMDSLTQIYNRKAFDRKLHEAFEGGRRQKKPFTLIMSDIDYFKKINDEYGHVIGDEVLKRVANTIKATFRLNDFVARYGGEEFVIMIDSVDKLLIRDLSERFRTDIESINFKIDEVLIPISISIGVAFYKESDTQESLVERADKAMYHAKKSGRNIVKTEEQLSSNKL